MARAWKEIGVGLTQIPRGALHGAGVETTITTATLSLILFAFLGLVLGSIAQSTVDEAVRRRIEQQLTELQESPGPRP